MTGKMNYTLPETDVHWNDVRTYIEAVPDSDYSHAPSKAMEAFRDMKFGVRIHWGLYSLWNLQDESWPFLKMSNEDKSRYQELYKGFDPKGFDAESWADLFARAGIKCMAFTSKHHEGFSMFDTKTRVKRRVNWLGSNGPVIEECDLAYSVMETPFGRDIVGELCAAAKGRGIKVDLYFSHPDWYDADFRPYTYHPLTVPDMDELLTERELADVGFRFDAQRPVPVHRLTGEERGRMLARHRAQLTELITNYDADMLCLDMWLGKNVWPELKETVKLLRGLKPEIMLRGRGIGNYGDYYTPEGFVPGSKENTDLPWMVIYPLAKSFSYDPDGSRCKGGGWIIRSLVDTVAKGGNFMVGIGPDENGRFHPKAVGQLEEAGAWLAVNGEAIYATRPREGALYKEGDNIRFTRSKDGKYIYAICDPWPGDALGIKTVHPREGTSVRLLGYDEPLNWSYNKASGLLITLPPLMQNECNRPCKTAYSFKIECD